MATTVGGRLRHAYNAFLNREDENPLNTYSSGGSYSVRPDRNVRVNIANERSIVSAIYNRIAIDVASVDIRHVRLDDHGRYVGDMNSGLNNCLSVEANIDQGARFAQQAVVHAMLNEGVIAVVPVDTDMSPEDTGGYDILTYRVGRIVQWFPQKVRVELYNDRTGRREEVTLNKRNVAIIENPLHAVMNEPNSTVQRLIAKLNILDTIDRQAGSGKLDMIIQLPYALKTETKKEAAAQRRNDIEVQLKDSQYGIAYTDSTEKITQLNRPAENNMLETIKYLTELMYSQLGITKAVMDGTADEKDMLNYISRTVEPILGAIAEEYKRKFLTKTARTQLQSIEYYRDPFKLVPMAQLAEIADKFTRNEIVTSNEFRAFMGMKPSSDPKADQLINSNNIKYGADGKTVEGPPDTVDTTSDAALDEIESAIDAAMTDLGIGDPVAAES